MKNQYRFFVDNEDTSILKHQLFNVLRLKIGDKISIIKDQKEYLCEINNEGYTIIEDITEDRETPINLTLCVASLKKDKIEYVLQKATEVGVKSFILFNGDNSVKMMSREDFDKNLQRFKKIIREACEQSLRINEPGIEFFKTIKDINFKKYQNILITDSTGEPFQKTVTNPNSSYLLVIGPEGGLSLEETNFLKSIKGQIISFGKRLMRSETASVVISAGIINYFENLVYDKTGKNNR